MTQHRQLKCRGPTSEEGSPAPNDDKRKPKRPTRVLSIPIHRLSLARPLFLSPPCFFKKGAEEEQLRRKTGNKQPPFLFSLPIPNFTPTQFSTARVLTQNILHIALLHLHQIFNLKGRRMRIMLDLSHPFTTISHTHTHSPARIFRPSPPPPSHPPHHGKKWGGGGKGGGGKEFSFSHVTRRGKRLRYRQTPTHYALTCGKWRVATP